MNAVMTRSRVFLLQVLVLSFLFLLSDMVSLRVGSLNINGGRDRGRRALVVELASLKNMDIFFLQETHSDSYNENEWVRGWKGESVFTHGTNTSAGAAILFRRGLDIKILTTTEVQKGRAVAVHALVLGQPFVFVNIYAPNTGAERVAFFKTVHDFFKKKC